MDIIVGPHTWREDFGCMGIASAGARPIRAPSCLDRECMRHMSVLLLRPGSCVPCSAGQASFARKLVCPSGQDTTRAFVASR